MESHFKQNASEPDSMITRASNGDRNALAAVFEIERPRLAKMVALRMDRRLQGRIDPEDVLQEAFVDCIEQLPKYASRNQDMSLFLWLRLTVHQRRLRLCRQHLGAEMRDVSREISIQQTTLPFASSLYLAEQLMGRFTFVSQRAIRAEMQGKLHETLNGLEQIDREIIALRNFEELTNNEVAEFLGLSKTAASNRYVRALARLQSLLEGLPGFVDCSR